MIKAENKLYTLQGNDRQQDREIMKQLGIILHKSWRKAKLIRLLEMLDDRGNHSSGLEGNVSGWIGCIGGIAIHLSVAL